MYQVFSFYDGWVTIMRTFETQVEAFLYASTDSTLFVRDDESREIELSHEERRGLARDVISDASSGYRPVSARELNAARVLWAALSNVQSSLVACHSCGRQVPPGVIDGWGCDRPNCCTRPDYLDEP